MSRLPELVIAAACALRLLLATTTDLSPDEAYYLCAARGAGQLVDHPPFIVWWMSVADKLPAFVPLELRIRLLPVVAAAVTSWLLVTMTRPLGPGATRFAAVASSFSILGLVNGWVAVPDCVALLAVTSALFLIHDRTTFSFQRVCLAGLALAVGSTAKVSVLPFVVAAAWIMPGWRARTVLLGTVALVAGPLLTGSLLFQLGHAFGGTGVWTLTGSMRAALEAISVQALLWSPWLLLGAASAIRRRLKQSPSRDLLLWTTLGYTVLVIASALRRGVAPEANWWAPALPTTLLLALGPSLGRSQIQAPAAASPSPKAPSSSGGPLRHDLTQSALSASGLRAATLWLAIPCAIAVAHTLSPFLPLSPERDPTARFHGWRHDRGVPTAAGVGPYGPAAERCVYHASCMEISQYFKELNTDSANLLQRWRSINERQ